MGHGVILYSNITAAPATITTGFDMPTTTRANMMPELQTTQYTV